MLELLEIKSSVLIGAFESVRNYSLAIGLAAIAGGILLFINHRRHLGEVLSGKPAERILAFEQRKYRRRSIVSVMITSVGCMLSALFWVTDERVFSVFILMIMGLLVGIMGVAFIDLFSVGLHQIATPDEKARKELVEEYLRQREKLADQENEDASS